MSKLKLTIEYAGEAFHGWQTQDNLITVQGELERALYIFVSGEAKKQGLTLPDIIPIQGSGRTDAGVHARGQVASFFWPDHIELSVYRLKEALNALTPVGLSIRKIEKVEENFDARHSPHIKCYAYRILYRGDEESAARSAAIEKNRSWVITSNLDIKLMIQSARVLEGQHDFQSFRAMDCSAKSTVRTVVRSELVRISDEELIYFIHGKGFLKQMVRIIVGTLVELGQGKNLKRSMAEILEGRDRSYAGRTAPADGLFLEWVRYKGGDLL